MSNCGIYAIEHTESKKVYIGSSVDIKDRWRQHRRALRGNTHHSIHLQRVWNLHGPNGFVFYELEACERDDLNEMETLWIATCQSSNKKFGYNTLAIAGSVRGLKHSEETRAKIRAAKANISDETRLRLSIARINRPPHSDATKEKMRASSKKIRPPLSEETKAKISATLSGRKQTKESIAHRSAALRGRVQLPEELESRRVLRLANKRYASDEAKANMSASAKARWAKKRSLETAEPADL